MREGDRGEFCIRQDVHSSLDFLLPSASGHMLEMMNGLNVNANNVTRNHRHQEGDSDADPIGLERAGVRITEFGRWRLHDQQQERGARSGRDVRFFVPLFITFR
jgi:hypothetical protein